MKMITPLLLLIGALPILASVSSKPRQKYSPPVNPPPPLWTPSSRWKKDYFTAATKTLKPKNGTWDMPWPHWFWPDGTEITSYWDTAPKGPFTIGVDYGLLIAAMKLPPNLQPSNPLLPSPNNRTTELYSAALSQLQRHRLKPNATIEQEIAERDYKDKTGYVYHLLNPFNSPNNK